MRASLAERPTLPAVEEMPLTTRRADLRPDSFSEERLTVEAVITAFADVRRRDPRGAYIERLSREGLDMSRLIGAPVLNGHRQGCGRDVIGIVQDVRREDDALVAIIRLSAADDAQPFVTRIKEGTLRGVSVGYRVTEWAESKNPANGERIRTAVNWQIFEVSAVPVPADPGCNFRSEAMPEVQTETQPGNRAELRGQIRTIARSAGLSADWADEQIDADRDLLEVRAAAFEAMQQRSNVQIRTQQSAPNDDPSVILTRREEALASRVTGAAPADHARQFMGERLIDHARAILTMRGVSAAGMDADQLFRTAMHTTSDFSNLLTGVGNRTLMPSYQAAQSPLKQIARRTTLNDFRKATRLRIGEIGPLEKVPESGEIKHTTRGEVAESYALDTYGSMFSLSRQALINDDLGAFRDWGVAAGRAAAETEGALLQSLLLQGSGAGPTMADGKRLFHADHGNTAANPGTIGEFLSTARAAMRQQKGLDGVTPINATPKFLVVGADYETEAEQALATIYPTTTAEANPFTGRLTLLVDPRLDDGWYLFADPGVMTVLEYAYLSSAQGPQVSSREGWDVLGMEFRVVLDFGCGAVDWRGAYRVPSGS